MEQIAKIDDRYYYGNKLCSGPDDVYRRFRNDYNAATGRAAYSRLSRILQRTERVHEFGFVFSYPVANPGPAFEDKLKLTLLGLVCGSYCWIADCRQIPEEIVEDWIDWALRKGSEEYRKTGKGIGTGRKDKRLNKRYR